jgi:hypothetical protein
MDRNSHSPFILDDAFNSAMLGGVAIRWSRTLDHSFAQAISSGATPLSESIR